MVAEGCHDVAAAAAAAVVVFFPCLDDVGWLTRGMSGSFKNLCRLSLKRLPLEQLEKECHIIRWVTTRLVKVHLKRVCSSVDRVLVVVVLVIFFNKTLAIAKQH